MGVDDQIRAFTTQRLGTELHYWTTGPDTAPLVVFTHGATLDHRMFDAQVRPVTAAGFQVLTWDMRGHGMSKPIGQGFTLELAADDLLAILDHLGHDAVTLIGQSFGGYVTQRFTFLHPDRINAMVIIGCTDLAARPSALMRLARRLLPPLLPVFPIGNFRKRTVAELSLKPEVTERAYEATGHLSKAEFIKIIKAGVDCLGIDAGFGDDYTVPVPFLLTHGAADRANGGIFTRSAPAWAARQPSCTYAVIPDAGHTANEDHPDAFNHVLLNFLARHVS